MRCERCGWEWDPNKSQPAPEIVGLPPGTSYPPLPLLHPPHPVDRCPSPFAIGDTVWWDMGGKAPDLPPILATFIGLSGFTGPEFNLENDEWVPVNDGGAPFEGSLLLESTSVLKEHIPYLGDFLEAESSEVVANIRDCTDVERWPTLVAEEPR
jgi:hypothetical protein